MVGFRGTIESHHHTETVKLPLKDGQDGTAVIPFNELVNSVGLKDKSRFYLHPAYWSGDIQTLALYFTDCSRNYQVYYGRRVITLEDGATLSADFVLPPPASEEEFMAKVPDHHPEGWPRLHPRTRFLSPQELEQQGSDDTKPILIISHGLGGGSHEPITKAIAGKQYSQGFDVVVLHARGCGRSKISTPELFNGLATDDLRNFLKVLRKLYPSRPFYGVGLSFGSTILTNYLGEEGDKSEYTAAAVLSNPWDFADSAIHISTRFWSKLIFLKPITSTLTTIVRSNRKMLLQRPMVTEEMVNAKYNSTVEFDAAFTSKFYGFQTPFQYYRAASSVNRLLRVKTPLLAISSFDDPVVGIHSIPTYEAEANPYVVLLKTDLGGHLAYIQWDGESWAANKISDYFKAFNETVDTTKRPVSDYEATKSVYDAKLCF